MVNHSSTNQEETLLDFAKHSVCCATAELRYVGLLPYQCYRPNYDQIQIKLGKDDDKIGTKEGEEEIKIYVKDENHLNLNKYLVKVIYDPSKNDNKKDEEIFLNLLEKNNIKYFIKNKK